MKNNKGFTLIELLVATITVGVVSVVGVNLLFSTVLSRSKQESISSASEDVRYFDNLLTRSVRDADSVSVNSSEIRITAATCRTIRLAGDGSLEMAEVTTSGCTPPSIGFNRITSDRTEVLALNFTQNGKTINYSMNGKNKDSLGEHVFSYSGQVFQRN